MTGNSNNIRSQLTVAAERLAGISDTPRLDAELLMAHTMGMARNEMLLHLNNPAIPGIFDQFIARRMQHEPVAYITGSQGFWDMDLIVTPDVLIPRADSETLIELAQEVFAKRAAPRQVADFGTGSGALALAALSLFPGARVVAIDASEAALKVAQANAKRLGRADKIKFLHQSWLEPDWADGLDGPFDLILCNPPYVESNADLSPMVARFEPHSALFAGAGGLDDYRQIFPAIPQILTENGVAIFEIGHEQGDKILELAAKNRLRAEIRPDLTGKARAVLLRHLI